MEFVNVFVYGSLMTYGANHKLLETAEFLSTDALDDAELVDLTTHPMLISGLGIGTVYGECYRVSLDTLQVLDRLEGHPNYYQRRLLRLRSGREAMVYTGDAEKAQGKPRISSGRWRVTKQEAENSREPHSISSTYAFLSHLRSLDIELFVDGEKLRCNAPPGIITPVLQAELAERKAEVMAFLLKGKLLEAKQWFSLFSIRQGGDKPALFWAQYSIDNQVVKHFASEQPIYGLRYGIGAPPNSKLVLPALEALATHYIEEMLLLQPSGPYFLAGHCFGGLLVYEMAQQLQLRGHQVGLVVLVDVRLPEAYKYRLPAWENVAKLKSLSAGNLVRLFNKYLLAIKNRMLAFLTTPIYRPDIFDDNLVRTVYIAYKPKAYSGQVLFFEPITDDENLSLFKKESYGMAWRKYINNIDIHEMPGEHSIMLIGQNSINMAGIIQETMNKIN